MTIQNWMVIFFPATALTMLYALSIMKVYLSNQKSLKPSTLFYTGVKALPVLNAYLYRTPNGKARDTHLWVDVCLLE
jgi:hypothetical protein